MAYPDFLCIGAPRAGTTWLYCNLQRHPEIWLPPKKEMYYFREREMEISTDALSRLTQRKFHNHWRKYLKTRLWDNLRNPKLQAIKWDICYLFGKRSDLWYEKCFAPAGGRITGDMTPAYAMLQSKSIKHIHSLMPHAKLIYILRNPIERTWSAVRYEYKRNNQEFPMLDDPHLVQLAMNNWQSKHNNYLGNIDAWSEFFPPEQLMVGFFEEITENPEAFLLRIFQFLGVDSSRARLTDTMYEKINVTQGPSMPQQLKQILTREYYPTLQQLQRFGGYTAKWLQEAEQVLQIYEKSSVERFVSL